MTLTKVVKLDPLHPDHHAIKEAASIVAKGGLVIIPTETVYGIAANMFDVQALARLYEIKQRPKEKPFTVHIDEKIRIEEFATRIPVSAYKLVDKFWPGPLTVILKSKDGGTVGLRLPDNRIARDIIAEARIPVVCPSANISGKPAATSFQEALRDLNGLVDFAVDGGVSTWGVESTVVDLTGEQIQILREGAVKKEEIESVAKKKNVLFICTGNTCRSLMAAKLFEKMLKDKNRDDVQVLSAGIILLPGMGPAAGARELLKKEGIDVSDYRSQKVTREMIKKSDFILAMEKIHEEHILHMAPEVQKRLFLLKEFAKIDDGKLDIVDPIGRPIEAYASTLAIIREALERIINLV